MILAVESSCDETALAIFEPATGISEEFLHSQLDLHKEYGGVVPELASREHLQTFPLLLRQLLSRPGFDPRKLDHIAVTVGPGLAPCLALGISHARALGVAWGVPVHPVNHLHGHAWSPFIPLHEKDPGNFGDNLAKHLPQLAMLVSGGNTLLFEIGLDRSIRILAQTIDDAAGEALDKGAKLLGLDYPGGALLEKQATGGDPAYYDFPRAFAGKDDMRFSYSGLKTSLRYKLEKMEGAEVETRFSDLCASYQQAVIDQLLSKVGQALDPARHKSIGLSGGVANNIGLRNSFAGLAGSTGIPLLLARPCHCGDNATMIAFSSFISDFAGLPLPALGLQPSLPIS
jgi:N6-L-threonylcarbamoyladenine synthase